jgi:hypothetical protein
MKQNSPVRSPKAGELSSGSFDLGTWLGRRQAFGMMAGKSIAADAECLRQIRDQRLYKNKTSTWAEFCARYIGASKPHVDRMIRHLEEFGPQFFQLSELTRIPLESYRAAAVAELRKRAASESASEPEAADASSDAAFRAVEKRLSDLIARIESFSPRFR